MTGMDPLDYIPIRFHFGGAFISSGGRMQYVGGRTGMSNIEVDKVSLPEIQGYLADHVVATNVMRMHWFRPGNGLMLLVDDRSCQAMADHVIHGGVADVFVEDVSVVNIEAEDKADYWAGDEAEHEQSRQSSEDKATEGNYWEDVKGKAPAISDEEEGTDSGTSDEEYNQPIEEDSSEEDEEVEEMRKFAREVKRNIKAKKLGFQGSQLGNITPDTLFAEGCNLDDEAEIFMDSSDEYSYGENSDGESQRWKSMSNRYDSKAVVPVFSLGMAFRCSRQFKKALIKYGITTHRHILFPKDEKDRVKAVCSWPGCKWLIYGSKTTRSEWFKVVTFVDDHCCPPRRDNKLVTSPLIAKRYFNEIRDNPTWKVELIKKAVLKDMLADVSIAKCKRAKALVLKTALDSMKGEYSKVYDYQMELLRSNPGSTVVVCLNPEIKDQHVYERFYVCFDTCKKGFLAGCRRVIGLDGCWFKGATNGQLLCAIGRDANNQMYPIAWAAVGREDYDSWYWFIGLLQKDLNINYGGEGWVIISDQQKGLLKAVGELVTNAEHRMCARHIYANWRKKYTDKKLQKKWWRVAKSPCKTLFNINRALLAADTPEGAADMMNTAPEHWSRAYFKIGSNCDSVDNNMCESFNHSIMEARFYPVISMHEAIRRKIMVRIQEQRGKAEQWQGTICPNIFKKLKVNILRSGKCYVLWNGEDRRYTVSLEQRTCTCRYWQLSGLPCCHAISAIYKASRQLDEFIAPCFSISEFKKTYKHCLQPVQGPDNWPTSDMPRPLPPAYVKMPGRPKTERTREPGEAPKRTKLSKVGIKMRCRLCRKDTHNAAKCPLNPEAGKKKNAYIKRDAAKQKKKQREAATTSAATSSRAPTGRKRKQSEAMHEPAMATQHSQASTRLATQGNQAPAPDGRTKLYKDEGAAIPTVWKQLLKMFMIGSQHFCCVVA